MELGKPKKSGGPKPKAPQGDQKPSNSEGNSSDTQNTNPQQQEALPKIDQQSGTPQIDSNQSPGQIAQETSGPTEDRNQIQGKRNIAATGTSSDDEQKNKNKPGLGKHIEAGKDTAQLGASVASMSWGKSIEQFAVMAKKAATDEEYRKVYWKWISGAVISIFFCCCGIPLMAGLMLVFLISNDMGQNYMQQRNLYNTCPSATFQTSYANDLGMPSFRNYADQCTDSDDFWKYYTKNANAKEPFIEDKVIAAIDQAGIPGTNNSPLCLGGNCPLENCNIKCSDQPCDQTPSCKSNTYPNASCSCTPTCAKAQCIQDCATKNLQTMQTRSKLIADRLRNIYEAEKDNLDSKKNKNNAKSATDYPIFDSWRTNNLIGDRSFDTVCRLFYDFALFDLNNPKKEIDYSQCANNDWTIKNYQDFNLFPDIQSEDVQCPNECVKTENCKCLQRNVLGTVTAYKYMIGYLQTDRCKNCQNPWPSLVCQEDGIDVDIDGKTGCVEAPEYWCLNCNCEDCQSLIGSGIVPGSASYYSTIGVLNGIPNELIDPFTKAAARYRISPLFLAAVFSGGEHGGQWPTSGPWAVGSSGDSGPFQFLECTWEGWNQSLCKNGSGKANGIFETNQVVIDSIGGYGQDGNNDNIADVNNLYDAAFAAADYLARAGATENGIPVTDEKKLHNAAARYNGGSHWKSIMAQNYADRVMTVYKKISN